MERTGTRKRFGYKGTETALNGLLNWMYNNYPLLGKSSTQRLDEACRVIVKYAEARIPRYKKRGHLHIAADYVAKKIQKNKKFDDFVKYTDSIKELSKPQPAQ